MQAAVFRAWAELALSDLLGGGRFRLLSAKVIEFNGLVPIRNGPR